MVEVLGAGLSLHNLIVVLGQVIVNSLDEAALAIRVGTTLGEIQEAMTSTG
jgi:hypothetical protein